MRYWLFVNSSGHKTKKNFLSKGEEDVKKFFTKKGLEYKSQHKLVNNVSGYAIPRLIDGFIPPETVIEVKEVNTNAKSAFKTGVGSMFELQGQCLALGDYHPSYKTVAIILGKDKKLNKIPKKTYESLQNFVDEVYTDRTLGGYNHAL